MEEEVDGKQSAGCTNVERAFAVDKKDNIGSKDSGIQNVNRPDVV